MARRHFHVGVLCAALGHDTVFSIELRPELVSLASTRLAKLGYHPVLRAADGSTGLAEYAPYDRIIATCAVSADPRGMDQPARPRWGAAHRSQRRSVRREPGQTPP